MTETIAQGAATSRCPNQPDAYAEAGDFLPLNGIDHVEFWVGNARRASAYYRALWGFTPVAFSGLETKVRDRASYVMVQNDIRFVFTARSRPTARSPSTSASTATACTTSRSRWTTSSLPGARRRRVGPCPPWSRPSSMGARTASCARPRSGPTARRSHSFVDQRSYGGVFAPGYRKVKNPAAAAGGLSLLEVDHCVGNVELGEMDQFVDFYKDVLGFGQLIHYDDKVIHTDAAPDVEGHDQRQRAHQVPDQRAGDRQEEEPDPGIPRLVSLAGLPAHRAAHRGHRRDGPPARENGVEFLGLPHEYYATLADRVGDVGVPIDTLEELGIEADRDEEGYLLQIFTRPVQDRPTFFFEIIERHGSRGFGVGNFKALFEAIEREQEGAEPLARTRAG